LFSNTYENPAGTTSKRAIRRFISLDCSRHRLPPLREILYFQYIGDAGQAFRTKRHGSSW
jgi:hypothetical protein